MWSGTICVVIFWVSCDGRKIQSVKEAEGDKRRKGQSGKVGKENALKVIERERAADKWWKITTPKLFTR